MKRIFALLACVATSIAYECITITDVSIAHNNNVCFTYGFTDKVALNFVTTEAHGREYSVQCGIPDGDNFAYDNYHFCGLGNPRSYLILKEFPCRGKIRINMGVNAVYRGEMQQFEFDCSHDKVEVGQVYNIDSNFQGGMTLLQDGMKIYQAFRLIFSGDFTVPLIWIKDLLVWAADPLAHYSIRYKISRGDCQSNVVIPNYHRNDVIPSMTPVCRGIYID